jgi:flagellum-specific peptidoglycan hydrolase FlgJ
MNQQDFFSKYSNFATASAQGSGISPLLILSQAFLESGGANSILSNKYYNFFGIKADTSWAGKKILLPTKEQDKTGNVSTVNQYFRVYTSPAESFSDHIKFLKSNPRYQKSGLFSYPDNFLKQADTLQTAGYATDINYASKLKNISTNFSKYLKPASIALPLILVGFFIFWKLNT